MRDIAIIGGGQAGLLLAIALQKKNYYITLFTSQTSDQIKNGHIFSSQGIFDGALQIERKWGLNFWDKICPENMSITFTLAAPSALKELLKWKGATLKPFQSVDQRLKFSRWLEEFSSIGGNLVIEEIHPSTVNKIAAQHELTIVASGKGEISNIFFRDNDRSTFSNPMRSLACLYVKGMIPAENQPGVRVNLISEVGEYFTMPGLTLNGDCEMMLFEGIIGEAFDCWKDINFPEERLKQAIKLVKKYIPWEAEKCENLQLADNQATLAGRYTPTIKKPMAILPCGKHVLGMGDAVVLNDPIAGQGANNATKAAAIYFDCITSHGKKPFDENWMHVTFEKYWLKCAQAATQWTNMLLLPPPPHVISLMQAASRSSKLANFLAEGFNEPSTLVSWITDKKTTEKFISEYT